MIDPPPHAIPAATLVIMRETGAGAPELLMVERTRAMAFAGGAMVFPGGRVDPDDRHGATDDDGAARIAAIRETVEEAGIAIGLVPPPSPAVVATLRARLMAGEAFGAILADMGLRIDPAALEPFSRWRPNHDIVRTFDTRFFLATLPPGSPDASVDGTENGRLVWVTAHDALDAADRGEMTLIFPTRRNLERLAEAATIADAYADARRYPIRLISPWVEARDGERYLCIPDDLGYPVTASPLDGAMRG